MPRCPAGHESGDPLFCQVCGIQIAGGAQAPTGQNLVRIGDLPAGARLGPPATSDRYEIERKVGQGGFGAAYLGLDRPERRRCVVKELLPITGSGGLTIEERRATFEREAQLLSDLQHPGLPHVWDAFEWQGRQYMVMSYEDGSRLEDVASQHGGRVSENDAIRMALDVASILGYLHGHTPPIVHRDISPDNIICRPGGSHALLDFGAARFYDAAQVRDTISLGKSGYAAPEAWNAQTDQRSDLYSLGAVLYRICVDYDPTSRPFSFPALDAVSGLSSEFRAILARLVEKRGQRFQSAQELILALSGLVAPSELCRACGRPIPAGAWRCTCGRSLLMEVTWATAGGDAAHCGRAPNNWSTRALVWRVEIGEDLVGGAVGRHGIAAVAGIRGTITGIDVVSGRTLWMCSIPNSPAITGGPALVGNDAIAVIGREIWAFDLNSGQAIPIATLDAAGPYVLTPIGTVLHVLSHDGHRWEVEPAQRTVNRRSGAGFEVRHGPACTGDRVIVGGIRGDLQCLVRGTDRSLWTIDLGSSATSALVVAGRAAISVSTTGEVRGVDIDTGRTAGGCQIHDQVFASPAITGSTLVVAGRRWLAVVDVITWALQARHPLSDALRSAAPVLLGQIAYTADMVTGTLRATDAATGASQVVAEIGPEVGGWLACIDGWVLAVSSSGTIAGIGPA